MHFFNVFFCISGVFLGGGIWDSGGGGNSWK